MGASVSGIHLAGDHASRPAGNTVPDGSLYSCSTHSLLYKSDYDGNSWSTWATLGGTIADILDLTTAETDSALVLAPDGAGGVEFRAESGGGGGGASELPIDAAATAAVGSGDLFGGTSLDGGWSSMQSTALTSNDRSVDGYLIQKNTGNTGGAHRGLKRTFSPAGDCSVYAKLMWFRNNTSFKWAGISLGATDPSDGGSGNRIDLFAIHNSGPKLKFAKYAAGVETSVFDNAVSSIGEASRPTDSTAQFDFPLWLRIKRVGSTLTAGISWSGVDWIDQATTTTIGFTINTICIFIAGSSDAGDLRAEWAYIATTG